MIHNVSKVLFLGLILLKCTLEASRENVNEWIGFPSEHLPSVSFSLTTEIDQMQKTFELERNLWLRENRDLLNMVNTLHKQLQDYKQRLKRESEKNRQNTQSVDSMLRERKHGIDRTATLEKHLHKGCQTEDTQVYLRALEFEIRGLTSALKAKDTALLQKDLMIEHLRLGIE